MDKSKVEACIAKHLPLMMDFMCVGHWTAHWKADSNQTKFAAGVEVDINYEVATFHFDHEKYTDEDMIIRGIFHEVAHVVLSTFDLPFDAAEAIIEEGSPITKVHEQLRFHAQEQGVINLERIWRSMLKDIYYARHVDRPTCKTGLQVAAEERPVSSSNDDLESIRDTLHAASRDISAWVQLGRRWQDESPDYGHDPKCPTDLGMASSGAVQRRIGEAFGVLNRLQGPEQSHA